MSVTLDTTINLGTILHLLGVTGLVVGLYYSLRNDLREVRIKVDMIWRAWHGENGSRSYEVRLAALETEMVRLHERLK